MASKFEGIGVGGILAMVRNRWPDWTAELVEVELPGTDAPTDRANVPPAPKTDEPKPQDEPKKTPEIDPVVADFLNGFLAFTWREALADVIAQDQFVRQVSTSRGTVEQRARIAATTMTLDEPVRVAAQTYQRLIRRPSERAIWYKGWLPPSAWARSTAKNVRSWLACLGLLVKIVDQQDGKGRHILGFELVGLGQITPQDIADTLPRADDDSDPSFGDDISDDPVAAHYRQAARDNDEPSDEDNDEDNDKLRGEDDFEEARNLINRIGKERRERRERATANDAPSDPTT